MPIFLGGTTQCNADLESGQRCVPVDCYRSVGVGLEEKFTDFWDSMGAFFNTQIAGRCRGKTNPINKKRLTIYG